MVAHVEATSASVASRIARRRSLHQLAARMAVLGGVTLLVLTLALGASSLATLPLSHASSIPTPQHPVVAGSNATGDDDIASSLLALAAGVAIAGGLIGTGMAQSGIGASGMGIYAEQPEKFGKVLTLFVIPETLWILGFVLGVLLLLKVF